MLTARLRSAASRKRKKNASEQTKDKVRKEKRKREQRERQQREQMERHGAAAKELKNVGAPGYQHASRLLPALPLIDPRPTQVGRREPRQLATTLFLFGGERFMTFVLLHLMFRFRCSPRKIDFEDWRGRPVCCIGGRRHRWLLLMRSKTTTTEAQARAPRQLSPGTNDTLKPDLVEIPRRHISIASHDGPSRSRRHTKETVGSVFMEQD